MAGFAVAMTDASKQRGVPELGAAVAAELGVPAFNHGYERWLGTGGDFAEVARRTFSDVRAAVGSLEGAE